MRKTDYQVIKPPAAERRSPIRRVLAEHLVGLPVGVKIALALNADAMVLVLSACLVLAMTLKDYGSSPPMAFLLLLVWAPLLSLPTLFLSGVYRVVARFAGVETIERLMLAMAVIGCLLYGVSQVQANMALHWRLIVLFTMVAFCALVGLRLVTQRLVRPGQNRRSRATTPVLIYGAGSAGHQLAQALARNPKFHAVAFADDNPALASRTVAGLPVWSWSELERRHAEGRFAQIFVALPSAGPTALRNLLERLETLSVEVMVMPSIQDIASGKSELLSLREVRIEDLLDRDPVPPVAGLLDACVRGRSVMVTGAGGSIGAELCRQIVRLGVRRLVLFDASEFALYTIERELAATVASEAGTAAPEVVPVLGTVLDRAALARVIGAQEVETIYHTAAYKHVPLVEANAVAATRNNVFGTLNTLQEAQKGGVRNFVLVSTDKAVRPTNIMGATKRVCELIVQALAQQHPHMRMTMVRFGNVLASSGSVVPVFREQLERGGPLTVTHPEVTRYFMTIPEAAGLVIQAGSMGGRGEVFVLDMGSPVRIMDLAERIIHLSGRRLREHPADQSPDSVAIVCTGLRPGEKLYEELLIGDRPEGTAHPRIFKAHEDFLPWPVLLQSIYRLERACEAASEEVIEAVYTDLVNGFQRAQNAAPVARPLPTFKAK